MSVEAIEQISRFLTPLSQPECERLKHDNPGLPTAYLAWMTERGWGAVGGNFMLYSGPTPLVEILGGHASVDPLVAIGDDFAGYVTTLNLTTGAVIELDPRGEEVVRWPDFEAFISEWAADHAGRVTEGAA